MGVQQHKILSYLKTKHFRITSCRPVHYGTHIITQFALTQKYYWDGERSMKRALCFPAQPKQPKMSLPKPVFFHKSAASFEYFPVKYLLTEVWCSGSSCPPVSKVKGRNAGQSAGAALWGECPKLTPCLPHPMAQGPSKGTNLDLFHQRAFRAGNKNSASQSQHI